MPEGRKNDNALKVNKRWTGGELCRGRKALRTEEKAPDQNTVPFRARPRRARNLLYLTPDQKQILQA